MKMLKIAGRAIPASAIESVTMPDYDHAVVWTIGRREPFHCDPTEVHAVRQYIQEAMSA